MSNDRFRAVFYSATLITLIICGCGESESDSAADDAPPATMPYICLETNEVFQLESQPVTPARNPNTGNSSLVPAYQDEKTKEWKPIVLPDRTIR